LATKNSRYVDGLARLSNSLRDNADGIDFLGFIHEKSVGAPQHTENMYAFKIYTFKAALQVGYKQILWVDSSCFAIKNVKPCFDEIERDGFLFQDAGHLVGNWSSDSVLKYYGITRDEAMKMNMIGNAGFLGLNFDMGLPNVFFQKWEKSMLGGQFLGAWTNADKSLSEDERCYGTRHDMSNSSIIINQMGLIHLAKSKDEWLAYAGLYDEVNPSIIFKAQGV
jgi:hypothetical protein